MKEIIEVNWNEEHRKRQRRNLEIIQRTQYQKIFLEIKLNNLGHRDFKHRHLHLNIGEDLNENLVRGIQ